MRRLAPATLEIIARSGLRWHNAANKAMVAAVLRSYIIQNDIDIDCLAAHYDLLRETSAGGEETMVHRFISSCDLLANVYFCVSFLISRV